MIDHSFFGELKNVSINELSVICGFQKNIEKDFEISGVATLQTATETEISFFGNRKYVNDLRETKAGAVIVSEADLPDVPAGTIALVCKNVMAGYAHALNVLMREETHVSHICASANVHKSAKIGDNCYIGDNVFIGENVEIGDDVVIGCNTVIEANCKIGSGGRIRHNVSIAYSLIGENVIINSGARLGESGFGIIPTESGMVYVKQVGRLIIGNRVRIGSNTTIDRGSIEDTVIGNDTIIDNLVQIGHNVHIGDRSIIVAQVGIAGSTKIGNGVVLAGQVGVAGHVEIGDGAIAAAKSGIASNVPSKQIVGGIPAVEVGIWKRQAAFLKMSVTKKKSGDNK